MPPSPEYLLVFGGAGLLLTSLVFHALAWWPATPIMRWLALLGRNALLVFVLQYYVYDVALFIMRSQLQSMPWWILFFFSIGMLTVAACCWDRLQGNRCMTVFGAWAALFSVHRRGFSQALAVAASRTRHASPARHLVTDYGVAAYRRPQAFRAWLESLHLGKRHARRS